MNMTVMAICINSPTAFSSLSLPPDKIGAPVMNLEVLKPISVQAGTAMLWFGQPGGGTQFLYRILSNT